MPARTNTAKAPAHWLLSHNKKVCENAMDYVLSRATSARDPERKRRAKELFFDLFEGNVELKNPTKHERELVASMSTIKRNLRKVKAVLAVVLGNSAAPRHLTAEEATTPFQTLLESFADANSAGDVGESEAHFAEHEDAVDAHGVAPPADVIDEPMDESRPQDVADNAVPVDAVDDDEAEVVLLIDFSQGLESVPIPVVGPRTANPPQLHAYIVKSVMSAKVARWYDHPTISSYARREENGWTDETAALTCCDCEDGCQNAAKCRCRKLTVTGRRAGYRNGRLYSYNGAGIYECNENCACQAQPHACANRVAQGNVRIPLTLYMTPNGCGWGVRAGAKILKGTFIARYVGALITNAEANDGRDSTYLADLNVMDNLEQYGYRVPVVVNAAERANIGAFFNHSCEPNMFAQRVFTEHRHAKLPELAFFALRDIDEGEPMCWNYAYPNKQEVPCRCGATNCRGWLK